MSIKSSFSFQLSCLVAGFAFTMVCESSQKTEQPEYIGVENCMLCHMPHFESWSETRMSKSYELLKPGARVEAKMKAGLNPNEDYSKNGACLGCHVTGWEKPGGFTSLEETPDMVGVQCEMCHGPGSVYTEMMMKKQGTYILEDYQTKGGLTMPSPENNVCAQQCHNTSSPFSKSGFEFDFENRKASGTHRHDLEYIYMPFDF